GGAPPPERPKTRKTEPTKAEPALTSQVVKTLRQLVTDFKLSGEHERQLFNLSKAERSQVHFMALSMGLKTASKGPVNERVLTMTRPQGSLNTQEHLSGARLWISTQVMELLKQAQPQVERMLHASSQRRNFTERRSHHQVGRPSNFGLIGQKLVPPEQQRQPHSSMMEDRRNLPIYGHRTRILKAMQSERVVIIQGATGSGKSTQVPQYILESAAQHRLPVKIVVSQPRRIAATTVAERIAHERGEVLGSTVGYQIRMISKYGFLNITRHVLTTSPSILPLEKCSKNTVLTLTTSGCLLRVLAMEGKFFFRHTTHLIIDEVHERDLDTDFLLLATKLALEGYPNLRLVLMSATMDLDALSSYFGQAMVIDVEGRSFSVTTWHLEDILRETAYLTWEMEEYLGEITGYEEDHELLAAYEHKRNESDPQIDSNLLVSLVEVLIRSGQKGAVIVYVAGYSDMVTQMERLESCLPLDKIKVLMMHSQLDSHEMRKVFHIYDEQLKVILSTNVGQTSITIPDLLFVIDTGRAKMNTYDATTDASQLCTAWISQADAQQRAGRAGRLCHGICYRLYSSQRFNQMSQYPIPEIRRRTLDEICLMTKVVAPQQKIARFLSLALDPPQPEAVLLACSRLQKLGILEETEEITPLGRLIAELPLGVQLGKFLIYSLYFRCLGSAVIIAAYHSVSEPFVLPANADRNQKLAAQNSRDQFVGSTMSDSLAILKLYKDFNSLQRHKIARFCEDNYVCRHSMEMFISAVRSLRESVLRMFQLTAATESLVSSFDEDNNMIRLALTAGLYPKLAYIDRDKRGQLLSDGDSFMQISRSSCLLRNRKLKSLPNDWVLFVEKKLTAGGHCSTLEHTTLVSSLTVALAAGKEFTLNSHNSGYSQLCLDTWIRLSCPTEFGQQLIRLRELIEREVAELVETRRACSAEQWLGPKLARELL
ncbi:hypothetical protein KR059_007291, partial [Drosophila kikkawai]